MRGLVVALLIVSFWLVVALVAPASAAPISCPAGQTETKTDGWWDCVNNGGNDNASGDSNNPNGNPNFRR